MNIIVYGLWHLGSVTAACLADKGFTVIGIDDDKNAIDALSKGKPPIFEPGLEALVQKHLASGALSFTHDKSAVAKADVVWVTLDTPVDEQDRADVESVKQSVMSLFPHLKNDTVVLISSQLPMGSTQALADAYRASYKQDVHFAYSPENLRLGKAIAAFNEPQRVVVGTSSDKARTILASIFTRYTDNILWMRIASAEMVKHGLNSFLATCITFINEIAELCETAGADAAEVERGLRSEPRIGEKAYIKPGSAFAGGTLARDVRYLCDIASDAGVEAPLLSNIIASNEAHKHWVMRTLTKELQSLRGKHIAMLGLAYTPGTDTLRRSFAIELCQSLQAEGAHIIAYDPEIKTLPQTLSFITLASDMRSLCEGAHALIVGNEHGAFKMLTKDMVLRMAHACIIDQNGWLAQLQAPDICYIRLGQPHAA